MHFYWVTVYIHVYNEYYICHLSKSHPPTHILGLTHFPRPPPHTPHTPTSHPVTFTQNLLTHSQTPPHTHTESPPLHHLPSAQNGYLENGLFFLLLLLLLQKLTQSMHLDNKLDWVNQHSFQGIHFVFLLGLSLFILNIKYLKLS